MQNEYTTIATRDPHSRAYQVLFDERSRQMVRALGRADGNAHEVSRCLACHATPLAVALGPPSAAWLKPRGFSLEDTWTAPADMKLSEKSFGVGCESCHGAARSWVYDHFPKKPRSAGAALATKTSVEPLENAAVRAAVCAGCHVGAATTALFGERNVDHDLIAAGHPRLLFEFVALEEAMPAHWKAKKRDAALDWFIGQMAAARAALDVLRQRAAAATSPWPEFAEFDCFACHHDLKKDSWRQRLTFGAKHKSGALPWNSWTFAVVTRLLKQHNLPSKEWGQLRAAIEMLSPANRLAVLDLINGSDARLSELSSHAHEWSGSKGGVAKLTAFLAGSDWASTNNWEAAEQYYFALLALKAASDDPALVQRIAELERQRGFDAEFISPRRFDPADFFGDALKR